MDSALILVRLLGFAAATALFGVPLFALYSGATPAKLKSVVTASGCATALVAAAALVFQTGEMAGALKAGLDPATLRDVLAGSGFGVSILVRFGAGLAACVIGLTLRRGRGLWSLGAALGAVALGALPWSGHGAADEGAAGLIHLAADIAHLLAAGLWLGALVGFLLLLGPPRPGANQDAALHRALKGFAGIGSAVVAVILASGLVNSWFLVGPGHLDGLIGTLWGRLMLAKIALFAGMLGLAAIHRFRLTPRLGASLGGRSDPALEALRRSVALETALGLAVLVLVAVLGLQPPPVSG